MTSNFRQTTAAGGRASYERATARGARREPLESQLHRHVPAAELAEDYEVELGDWVSLQRAEARAANAVVAPRIEALGAAAEEIGKRRGRLRALIWSVPIAIAIAAVAVCLIPGVIR